jgi:DNA-binding MurR/RpiR family transcriptional regulator
MYLLQPVPDMALLWVKSLYKEGRFHIMTNIEIKTRSILDSLNNSEKKVANYLLNNIENIFSMPVARLAEEAGVSQVTWVRFCKALGFDGLKDLKRSLFLELNNATASDNPDTLVFSDIKEHNNIEKICITIKYTAVQAIEDTMKIIDYNELSKIIKMIEQAERVQLFGIGASGIVAEDLYRKLIRIGKNSCFSYDTHTQLTYGANLSPTDIAIIFSYSGTTKEMLEILALAQAANCPTIAITKFAKSPLVAGADYSIYISTLEVDLRSGAMSSRLAQLTVVDMLFTVLASRNYTSVEKYLEKSYEACRAHKQ